jgi:tetratricopeptide (TPR) repeat protein
LARLSHPNVLTVFDVGTFQDQVFLATELVVGSNLREWLVQRPRSLQEVLRVFIQAGQGLRAAHAAGLVHRDFKPENVLVGDDGRVRVLDFGLARAVAAVASPSEQDGTTDFAMEPTDAAARATPLQTPLTQFGDLMGTPAYMAPEQIAGEPTDARTDQFSFCVALFEALYGVRPFGGGNLSELAAAIEQGAIARPAKDLGVPAWLRRALLRGLRAEPGERYPALETLLDELAQRQRSSRRRKLLVTALTLALVTTSAVVLVLLWQVQPCRGAERKMAGVWDPERKAAIQQAFARSGTPFAADTWSAVERIVDSYSQEWIAAHSEACEATRVRGEQSEELLDLRMRCLSDRLRELRALTALFADADRAVVTKAPRAARALAPLRNCSDEAQLMARVRPPQDAETRARLDVEGTRLAQAKALERAGKYREGLSLAEKVAQQARTIAYRPFDADALATLALLQDHQGQYRIAEDTAYEALWAALAGMDERLATRVGTWLAVHLTTNHGRHVEARRWLRLAAAVTERHGADDEARILLEQTHGVVALGEGQYEQARAHFETALSSWRSDPTSAQDRFHLSRIHQNLAATLSKLGRFEDGLEHDRQTLAIRLAELGPAHPEVADAKLAIAASLQFLGRFGEAGVLAQQALSINERALGADHPELAEAHLKLGALLFDGGDYAKALVHYERALALTEKHMDPGNLFVGRVLDGMGATLAQLGRLEEGLQRSLRALAIRQRALGEHHSEVAVVHSNLGEILRDSGRIDEALYHCQRAKKIWEKALGPGHPHVGVNIQNLGEIELLRRRYADAQQYFERALAIFEKALGKKHLDVAYPLTGLGRALIARGAAARATPYLERALALREGAKASAGDLGWTRFALAQALWAIGKDKERARTLAMQARDSFAMAGAKHKKDLALVVEWLGRRGRL